MLVAHAAAKIMTTCQGPVYAPLRGKAAIGPLGDFEVIIAAGLENTDAVGGNGTFGAIGMNAVASQ